MRTLIFPFYRNAPIFLFFLNLSFVSDFRTDHYKKPAGRLSNIPDGTGRGFKFIITAYSEGKSIEIRH